MRHVWHHRHKDWIGMMREIWHDHCKSINGCRSFPAWRFMVGKNWVNVWAAHIGAAALRFVTTNIKILSCYRIPCTRAFSHTRIIRCSATHLIRFSAFETRSARESYFSFLSCHLTRKLRPIPLIIASSSSFFIYLFLIRYFHKATNNIWDHTV